MSLELLLSQQQPRGGGGGGGGAYSVDHNCIKSSKYAKRIIIYWNKELIVQ